MDVDRERSSVEDVRQLGLMELKVAPRLFALDE